MTRLVSIRQRLLRNIVTLIVLLGAVLLVATLFGNRRTVETLSRAMIEQTADHTETALRAFFGPVVQQMQIAEAQTRAGLLAPAQPDRLNGALEAILRAHPQVSSLMSADDGGREHMLLRMPAADGSGTRWRARRTDVQAWGRKVEWTEWSDADPTPRRREEDLGYDPRTRPWFQGALAKVDAGDFAARVAWTEPYTFFTTKDPGITASAAQRGNDGVVRVLGFDILLNDISLFTTSPAVQPSANGIVCVLAEESGEVLGLPRMEPYLSAAGRRAHARKSLDELGVALLHRAAAELAPQLADGSAVARLTEGGEGWWCGARRVHATSDRAVLILVAVPEADILGGLALLRWIILGVVLLTLALAIWRGWLLADRFSDPIEALVAGSERIAKGDLEPRPPIETDLREVHALAEAQERMRQSLTALMKLERDLQVARQIQQNTFPDILPGLRGFDVEGWSEPADETGGDTYDVIGLTGEWARASLVASEESADRAVLMLADATGHGIGPALSALQLRAMLRMAMRMGGDLGTIVKHMNRQLFEDLPGARFLTTWIGMLDPSEGTLRTFSAGQAPLLHFHAATGEVEVLQADAPPFGILESIPIQIGVPVPLQKGDLYLVFSDGIFEAKDPDGALFDDERVIEIVKAHRHRSPREILAAIRKAVEVFARGRPADDDRTAVIIKRL